MPRKYMLWTRRVWDCGFTNNSGRFLVYRPDYPRAYHGGYALRAHVVWWLKNGRCHPRGMDLHHKNSNKIDDRIANLQLMPRSDHISFHKKKIGVRFKCDVCGHLFHIPEWRVRQRMKDGYRPRFCSRKCTYASPFSALTRRRLSRALTMAYMEGRRRRVPPGQPNGVTLHEPLSPRKSQPPPIPIPHRSSCRGTLR